MAPIAQVASKSRCGRHWNVTAESGSAGAARPSRKPQVKRHTVVQKNVTYVVTDLSIEDHQEYYNGFANRVLWPILHFRLDLAEFARRDLTGYMRVNDHFATELEGIIEPDDLIWVHDYHLIPIADALRRRGHANRIGFFLHVPMPPPEVMTCLPNHEQLIPLLLQYDVVGFQTDGDAGNFVRYLITENRNSHSEMTVFESSGRQITFALNGRQTRIGSFPVGIEPAGFQTLARRNIHSPLVKDLAASLGGRTLVIGVDRLDYSKGLVQRLEAFELFLARNPGLARQGHLPPDHAAEPLRYSRICGVGAGRELARRPHQREIWRGVVDADPLRQPRLQPLGACRPLSICPGRPGHTSSRRDEPRREGVHRSAGPGRSRRADPVALRRRRRRVQTRPARQPL